jgi:hypothetical protein
MREHNFRSEKKSGHDLLIFEVIYHHYYFLYHQIPSFRLEQIKSGFTLMHIGGVC